ncbi:MAG: PKD repeat protein [Saprospiraceae bacterium]|jgi:PKD repeat protein
MKNLYLIIVLFVSVLSYQSLYSQCDITLSDSIPCAKVPVNFSVDSPSGSYGWDFNNDGLIDAFGASVNYTFPENNIDINYTIVLYRNGSTCNTINVLVLGLPDPSIGIIPGSGILEGSLIRVCSGSPLITLEVYNSSLTYATNQTYEVNWGDGNIEIFDNVTFSNTSTITHDYTTYGYYNLSMTTTSIGGCTNLKYYTLYNGSNPSVGLANPGNTVGICAPATIDFPITNTGTNPTGTIYTLYVSGEVVALYTQSNVPAIFSYTFLESSCGQSTGTGNYQNAFDVQILASNPCGSSQATIEPIELSSPPEVLFVSDEPTAGCEEETYTFTNASGNLAEVIAGTCTSLTPSWTITPGIPGIHWEIISGNTFASEEIEIIFLIPGEYTIEMTINSPSCGSGTYSQSVTISEAPGSTASGGLVTASVPAISDDCLPSYGIFSNESTGDSLSFDWQISPAQGWAFVDTFNQNSTDLQVLFTETGTYTVSLSATNFCGTDTWDTTLVVADIPEVAIAPIPTQCETATLDFDPSMVTINTNYGILSSVQWSFPGAVPASSNATYPTNIYYGSPGNYTIEVTITNQCGTHTASQNFVIEAMGSITVSNNVDICEDGASFSVSGTPVGGVWSGNGVTNNGAFTPSNNNVGDNVLVYTYQDGACTLQDSLLVTVTPLPVVDAGADQEACINEMPFVISGGTPANGTWTVNNGGVITGGVVFDPAASGVGVYTLTYTYTDPLGCTGFDTKIIIINDLPSVDAGPDQSLCENPFDFELTGASPSGGIWSGTGVNPNGTFNAAIAGQGTFILTYNYTDPNTGCANVDSLLMTVVTNETANAGPDETLCLNNTPFIINSGTPLGGYWIGSGVDSLTNIFDPELAGLGNHLLTYSIGEGVCQTEDTKIIIVLNIPDINLPVEQLLCINDLPYDLSAATPLGGIWTGSGINGNTFDPGISGVGVHSITYTYTNLISGCSNFETMEMEVVPLPNILVNDTTYCNTPGLVNLPLATPVGGNWSGIGVIGNDFDPVLAGGAGTYTALYTYSDNNNCENSENITITVIEPVAINAGIDFEICIDEGLIDLSQIASPLNGLWNANGSPGLSGAVFNPAIAGVGVHVLTYSIGFGNCQVSDNIAITINPIPVVNTMNDFEVCRSETVVVLTATPAGGGWIANNGAILAGNIFNANLSGEGVFSFTYTYVDGNGCENSDNLLVTVYGLPSITTVDTTFCNTPGIVSLPSGLPLGGTWSGLGVSNNMFDPQAAGGTGSYELTYSYQDIYGCQNSGTATITIVEPAIIDAGVTDVLCIDQGPFQLSGFIPANGLWSGPGIIDAINGIVDPAIAGAGVHQLTYTYGTGNCYVEDTKTIEVIDLTVNAGTDLSSCFTYESFVLEGYSPTGGLWSGTGITDAVNGIFDPAVATAGTHVLTYIYTDPVTGCARSDTKEITIFPMEEAAFTMPDLACRNEPVQFVNQSNTSYDMQWSFGLGAGTSTAINPVHIYDVSGTYTITLIVENQFGCRDTIIHEIIIADSPEAFFEPGISEACVGTGFEFSNQSFGDSLSYFWEFGDFQTSILENPGTIYFDQGNYDTTYVITLTVSNICGTRTYQDIVLVRPSPVANFGIVPLTECSPLLVDFANASTGSATEYFWDFGNGNTSTEQFPETETYFTDSTFSIYNISLIATNICGADTITTDLLVESANVVAAAAASVESGCVPLTVDFSNSSTAIASIEWDFGDGNTSSQTDPAHTFTEAGEYTVIQYANSDCGYDTTTLNITVFPSPEVNFTHDVNVCSGEQIEFVNNSVNTSGNFWDFGDGNTSTLNNPVHTYNVPGEYTITLTGSSMFNQCDATYTSTVTILELPVASFEPSTTYGCAALDVQFVNLSTGALFYQWNFGDNNTSIDENPTHTFEDPGTYEVTLLATDGNGCYEDFTIFNIIVTATPVAAFDYEKAQSCGLPATIYFENQTEGGIDFEWSFGQGSTSPFTNPAHTFTEAGTYEITLVAQNQYGCSDTTSLIVEVFENPSAGVEIESMNGCEPLEVRFNNTSSFSTEYLWDFGDGTTSIDSDPTHTYSSNGQYQVQLIASIADACSDTVTLSDLIEVYPSAFANFETFRLEGDGTYELTNMSLNADTYYWEFSDAFTSDLENPVHRFSTNGVKQIYLEASNEYGCVDDTLVSFIPEFIKGLFLPNAFSPEQGIGDVRLFKPKGIGLKEYHIQIFSTYGQLLWQSSELDEQGRPAIGWDGMVEGKLMPQDVYVWRCSGIFIDGSHWGGEKAKDGNYRTIGSLVLLR